VRKVARETTGGHAIDTEVLYPSMYFGLEKKRYDNGGDVENSHSAVNNVYLNGVRVAAVLPSGKAFYYLTDQVDSVKVVVNDSGMPVSRMEYLPFGDTWFQEGDLSHNPKYNSQELDKETGYYFYNARHYDAGIGRFVTPDSVIDGEMSTQGWNRYSYVKGNPIVYKDPTGHVTDGGGIFIDAGCVDKGFSLSLQVVEDDDGNTGISLSFTTDVITTPSASAHLGIEKSTANTIYDTAGKATTLAVGGGQAVTATVEGSYLDGNGYAIRASAGGGVGSPISVSATESNTYVVGYNKKTMQENVQKFKSNVKEIINGDKKIGGVFDDLKNPFGFKGSGEGKGWAKENVGKEKVDYTKKIDKFLSNARETKDNIIKEVSSVWDELFE